MQYSNDDLHPEAPLDDSEEITFAHRQEAARLEKQADAWLAGETGDNSALNNATAIDELLRELIAPTEPLQPEHLIALSDMNASDAAVVQRDWLLIPTERRRAVIIYLVEPVAQPRKQHSS